MDLTDFDKNFKISYPINSVIDVNEKDEFTFGIRTSPGDDYPSKETRLQARKIVDIIVQKYPTLKYICEDVDEWINITITNR